jgi:hypothetical protein
MIRKPEREQRQAINRYNQDARRYNAELKLPLQTLQLLDEHREGEWDGVVYELQGRVHSPGVALLRPR